MTPVPFQGKQFNITVLQVNTPNTDVKEAEIDWFYEDIQHLLELILKNNAIFFIKGWNAKVVNQKIPRIKRKFGFGVQNEAGERLIEFYQENTLFIANTLF